MNRLIKKIHIYAGLLSFIILLVDGTTGVGVTLLPRPEERSKPAPTFEVVDFAPPGNLNDAELARAVWEFLKAPLTAPPRYGIRRDESNNLTFGFYTPKSVMDVIVLEKERKLRVETQPVTGWMLLNNLHSSTVRDLPVDWRMRLWALYNEFAILALLFLSLSGLYLWLSTRPRHRIALASLALGSGSFAVLYFLSR